MIAAIALLLAASPLTSPIREALTDPVRKSISDARVGQWVTFRVDGGGNRIGFWRLAVVGEERDPLGRPAVWVELELGQHPGLQAPLLQIKLLVARRLGMSHGGVTRVVIAAGAERPNELAADALDHFLADDAASATGPGPGPNPGLTTSAGPLTRLMTPAGTVWATPVEARLRSTVVKRIWVSEQIPLLHLAKLELPGISHTVEVQDFGLDAQARIGLPAAGTAKIELERYDALVRRPE
jgi:hypothetical protein